MINSTNYALLPLELSPINSIFKEAIEELP